jgi:hypothetical protein
MEKIPTIQSMPFGNTAAEKARKLAEEIARKKAEQARKESGESSEEVKNSESTTPTVQFN